MKQKELLVQGTIAPKHLKLLPPDALNGICRGVSPKSNINPTDLLTMLLVVGVDVELTWWD